MNVKNTPYKMRQSLIQNHTRHECSESAPELRIALLYIKAVTNNINNSDNNSKKKKKKWDTVKPGITVKFLDF